MIVCWSRGDADHNMDESILVGLGDIIARHPWWQARGRLVVALLRHLSVDRSAAILEAGCGWGVNITMLEEAGYAVTGLDISRRSLERLDRTDRKLIEADLTKDLPVSARRYDVVLALDVIEHIDDDSSVVRRLGQLTKPGGYVILSVPALPELYSEFDEIQGHRRRYTYDTLREAIGGAGLLEVCRIFWWGQWMARVLGRRKSARRARPGETGAEIYKKYLELPPWPAPYLMKAMFAIDHKRTLREKNVTGTSLFAIAMRSKTPDGVIGDV
jgi:SAM-dependent methyltransferase